MLDLIALSTPSFLQRCSTVPPLENCESLPKSYHLGLLLQTQWRHCGQHNHTAKRTIWLYKHADWPRAQRMIEETDWSLLITDDIDVSWNNWRRHFKEEAHNIVSDMSHTPQTDMSHTPYGRPLLHRPLSTSVCPHT